jgi:hypothetical protein
MMMENPRTTNARDHDDSEMIENELATPTQGGAAGGNIARDNASENELAAVSEPDSHLRMSKQGAIANNTARRSDRRGG